MIPLFDLATFPASQCPDDSYLNGPVEIKLRSLKTVSGDLAEFNAPRSYLTIQRDKSKRLKVRFDDIQMVRFTGAIPRSAADTQVFAGKIRFVDGKDWVGEVIYYLNDRYGLHMLAREDKSTYRYFFPASVIESQQVSALFGQMLMDKIGLSRSDLEAGLARQDDLRKQAGGGETPRLGAILCQDGKVSEKEVQMALAESLGLDFVELKDRIPDQEAVELIPEAIARENGVVPINKAGRVIRIAIVDPKATEAMKTIGFLTGMIPEPVITTQSDIEWAMDNYYRNVMPESLDSEEEEAPDEVASAVKMGSEAPVVRLVNNILSQAVRRGTSDIHIRPNEKNMELIFRIDGVMTLIREFRTSLARPLVARIKIMSGMDISERRLPQDGQLRIVDEGAVIDMRVSVIPTVEGESVVIRVLNTKYGPLSIEQLGFEKEQEEVFLSSLDKAHGLVLVTGPTGSGKSTTLYAALDVLLKKNLSIITIENPVEFHIPGIDQVQVNQPIGLTFARVLRNVLRHDPEVIMVGEIRDQETAEISIQSAMTGHLVLSTLHTNSAVGAVGRLLDMHVENYILGPTLLCVVAQRLLKKLCQECVAEVEPESGMLRHLGLESGEVFYKGTGCEACNNRGLKGRVGVYEVLNAYSEFKEAVISGTGETGLLELARAGGMSTLLDNAIRLARNRQIDLAQAYSIAADL